MRIISKKLPLMLIVVGVVTTFSAFLFTIWLYWPVFLAETQYRFVWSQQPLSTQSLSQANENSGFVPYDRTLSVTIPKIRATAPIVLSVDPSDSFRYQKALQQGVAHAAGSALPDQPGITFLFAHSSANQLTAQRYNAVFYLLNKLNPGDEILLYYNSEPYTYRVTKITVVNPDQVNVMQTKTGPQQLVLMTCTPAGTTARRLLVYAQKVVVE